MNLLVFLEKTLAKSKIKIYSENSQLFLSCFTEGNKNNEKNKKLHQYLGS